MSYFHPLEVVGRGSETQLQVGENLNKNSQRSKGSVTSTADLIAQLSYFEKKNTKKYYDS